ncbi:MFS transporter [Salinispirillum marinum]|uniref:MFS transporter n=2 Tax=Saccharospirillaceae TaxID=255527 RepID=A0ABV8BEN0_9GAMM
MRWLEGLFSLRQDELTKALPFLGLLVCLFGGVTIARNLAMSFVVTDMGKEALPLLFSLIGVFQLLFALVYAVLSARFGTRQLYNGLLVALAVFCAACMLLLWWEARWASALLYVGLFVLLPVILIHDGTHLASYLNPHEQKKLAGFIAAGIPLGAMLGGALLVVLLKWVPPVLLLLALPLSAVLTILMVLRIARRRVSFGDDAPASESVNPLRQMHAGVKSAAKVPLIKWLAAGVFVATVVQQLMVYFYQGMIYPTVFPDIAERAAFFGKYDLFMNFAALLFQLTLASRLINRLGVGVSSVLHPVLYLGSAILLAVSQGLLAGIVSQAVNQELRTYFRKPVDNLLFNGLNSKLWGVSKAFLGGIVQPVAILFSTLLLFLLQAFSMSLMLPLLQGLVVLFALLGVALVVPQARAYDAGVLALLNWIFWLMSLNPKTSP